MPALYRRIGSPESGLLLFEATKESRWMPYNAYVCLALLGSAVMTIIAVNTAPPGSAVQLYVAARAGATHLRPLALSKVTARTPMLTTSAKITEEPERSAKKLLAHQGQTEVLAMPTLGAIKAAIACIAALGLSISIKRIVTWAFDSRQNGRSIAASIPPAMISIATTTGVPGSKALKGPVFSEKCDQVGITLTRFMNEMARANPELAEIEPVFASIQTAGKAISKLVQRAAIDGMLGKHGGGGSVNVQGEEQKKLDVIANDLLKKVLKYTGRMGIIASEEEDNPVEVDNTLDAAYGMSQQESETAKYVTVFDPLDGSSNIDAGIPVGTIFGIFEQNQSCMLPENFFESETTLTPSMQQCLRSTLQSGESLVAAGYVLYSSSTYFVFTLGAGVNGFTLDHSLGEFVLTHPNICIPPRGRIFSINSANRRTWDEPVQVYIDSLSDGTNKAGTRYTSRYIGSMVGDVHRTLMYGGVFAYPADSKNPRGKLRLLYEAAPMAFLVEQAGGRCTTGVVRIMDVPPRNVHQRVPCIMGGEDEVAEVEQWYNKLADKETKNWHTSLLHLK